MKFKSLKTLLESLEKEKAIPLVVVGYKRKTTKKGSGHELMYFANPGLDDVTEFDDGLADILQSLSIKYTRRGKIN